MGIPAQAAVKVYVVGSNGIVGDIVYSGYPETTDLPEISELSGLSNQTNMDQGTENQNFVRQVFDLVNIERAQAGLSPLNASETVSRAAMLRAKEIAGDFSHTCSGGRAFGIAMEN